MKIPKVRFPKSGKNLDSFFTPVSCSFNLLVDQKEKRSKGTVGILIFDCFDRNKLVELVSKVDSELVKYIPGMGSEIAFYRLGKHIYIDTGKDNLVNVNGVNIGDNQLVLISLGSIIRLNEEIALVVNEIML